MPKRASPAGLCSTHPSTDLGEALVPGAFVVLPTGAHFDNTDQPSGIAGSMSARDDPHVPSASLLFRAPRDSGLGLGLGVPGVRTLGAYHRPWSVGRSLEPQPPHGKNRWYSQARSSRLLTETANECLPLERGVWGWRRVRVGVCVGVDVGVGGWGCGWVWMLGGWVGG